MPGEPAFVFAFPPPQTSAGPSPLAVPLAIPSPHKTLAPFAVVRPQRLAQGPAPDLSQLPPSIANSLARRGKQLRAGQFVITGSLVTSKFPRAGDAVGFDLGELGRIELKVN